ncbi:MULTISPECIES: galactose-1-epimerase [Glaesserella]|uniref:Aldose 1-epimerase n=1 Tax=Glaesserella australis TaxID=2094024 RepID=A0A328BUZ1_9PAST|nr:MULTISPECIES: galactose-1-epimerase [Glaesserella]AUI65132.1 galactose-1-epimerase [Glaesserella sp. 15-184]RAL18046.1 galactose-1-epimerase [Glaesserella australis]
MNLYILENPHLKITLSDFGASWLSCIVKLSNEQREVLVTTTPERWHEQSAYFGATVGRYANRIANGEYQLNGNTFKLAQNNGENNLHGGLVGADKCVWQVVSADEQAITFHKIFANGEEGFGGEVSATVTYRLNGNQLELDFRAISNEDTPLCFTNHAYFNLSNEPTIHQHQLQLNAEHYLPVGSNGIPNAPLKAVVGTSFDFRKAKPIGRDLLADSDQQAVKGYDHAFLLAKNSKDLTACLPDATLSYDNLRLELRTTKPALQIYTGNWLGGQPDLHNGEYADYAGVALEPEFFPDTPNHPEWWHYGGISKANEPYQHQIHYRFIVE